MSSRFLTNITLALLAGFLVVASQAFAPATMTWLMLGVGAAALVIVAPAIGLRRRGRAQQGIDALIAILAAWMIVAGLVFAGAAVTWLGFSAAAGIVALAVIGLIVHELSTERVVHSLEVYAHEPEVEHKIAEMRA